MLAIAVVGFRKTLIAQMFFFMIQSTTQVIMLEYVRPFKLNSQRRTEIFNEVMLVMVFYTMFCFTAWVPSVETKS